MRLSIADCVQVQSLGLLFKPTSLLAASLLYRLCDFLCNLNSKYAKLS